MLQHFKKTLKEQIMGQKAAKFWPKLGVSYSPKRLFFGKVDHWSNYCIQSCYIISKKSPLSNKENKVT